MNVKCALKHVEEVKKNVKGTLLLRQKGMGQNVRIYQEIRLQLNYATIMNAQVSQKLFHFLIFHHII